MLESLILCDYNCSIGKKLREQEREGSMLTFFIVFMFCFIAQLITATCLHLIGERFLVEKSKLALLMCSKYFCDLNLLSPPLAHVTSYCFQFNFFVFLPFNVVMYYVIYLWLGLKKCHFLSLHTILFFFLLFSNQTTIVVYVFIQHS